MHRKKLLIVGAGGLGREIAAMVKYSALSNEYDVHGFIDDGQPLNTLINGVPIAGNLDFLNQVNEPVYVAIAIGNPSIKAKMLNRLDNPLLNFPTLIHPSASIHHLETVTIGRGCIICAGVIITTDVQIGDFSLIGLRCVLGHDTQVGDCCTIMPGTISSGGAKIKNRVYLQTGTMLPKPVVIEDDSVL